MAGLRLLIPTDLVKKVEALKPVQDRLEAIHKDKGRLSGAEHVEFMEALALEKKIKQELGSWVAWCISSGGGDKW